MAAKWICIVAFVLSAVIVLVVVLFIDLGAPLPDLSSLPPLPAPLDPHYRIGTAETFRSLSSFMVTLGAGLVAVVGVTLSDGLGDTFWMRVGRCLFLCGFVIAISASFLGAYHTHAAIIVQLDRGLLFIERLERPLVFHAWTLIVSALFAFGLVTLRIMK